MINSTRKELKIACIVDDDPIFTRVLEKQMKAVNFAESILIFPNGLDALNHLQSVWENPEQLPCVILLDLNMPILDGWQFLNEFSKLTLAKNIIVYIVSSSIDKIDHEKALSYQAVSRFCIKPVSKEQLEEILNEVNEI